MLHFSRVDYSTASRNVHGITGHSKCRSAQMNNNHKTLVSILVVLLIATAVSLAGSQGGIRTHGIPLFLLCAGLAFTVQWVMFVPAYLFQTEKYYDLTGSLTYISVALIAQAHSTQPAGKLIAALVCIWALRLGSFLFLRIRRDGKDTRFDRIRGNPLRFLLTWTLQGLWVVMTFAAGLAAITSGKEHGINLWTLAGTGLWMLGFGIEVIADEQKRRFRARPENRDRFITSGLWGYSRHPNYFGEILLWTGIAVIAVPALSGWQYLTLISPLFVFLLLTRVSGVSMLEAGGKKRWGDDPAYRTYVERTPVLVPGIKKGR